MGRTQLLGRKPSGIRKDSAREAYPALAFDSTSRQQQLPENKVKIWQLAKR